MSTENGFDSDSTTLYGPKATLAQLFAVFAQSFLFIGLGMTFSVATIVICDLYQNPSSDFVISLNEAAWYGSTLYITQPAGCFLSGIVQETFGKKLCILFGNIPSVVGWIILCYADTATVLCTSNLLMGLSIGFCTSTAHPYVGEMTEPRLRGVMSSLLNTATFSGQVIGFTLGFFFEWRTVARLCALCPVVCACLVIFIPESPIWLVTNGENARAKRSLCWLRGWVKPETIERELLELVHYSRVSGTDKHDPDSGRADTSVFSKLCRLKDPSVYRPFNLLMVYFFVAFVVGIIPARPFLGQILTDAGLSDNKNLYLIIFPILQAIGSVVLSLTVHRFGKRFLTLNSVFINSMMLMLLGVYVMIVKSEFLNPISWIPFVILSTIFFSGLCGVSCICWMLLGEVFPNKHRGFMTGLCSGVVNILLFAQTKSFLAVESLLSFELTMVLFGGIGMFGFIYFYYCLPESENKTFLEIEESFLQDAKNKLSTNTSK